ncbi:MAG: T9SS type A sorting domain-containing protein [Candidatus Eisenbacteria bacterium]|nr:T9SS type A sorting domain-containing protein [Candidatus Eisenbacteria bacterium]
MRPLIGLSFNLFLFGTLRFMIDRELITGGAQHYRGGYRKCGNIYLRMRAWIRRHAGRVASVEPGYFLDEDENGVADAIDELRAMRDVMLNQGFILDEDLMVVEDEGDQHSEEYWAARFPITLQYLFPYTISAVPSGDVSDTSLGRLVIQPNVPNPFHPLTVLRYELTASAIVSLQVFDVGGRLIRTLISSAPSANGTHFVEWNGRDDEGRQLPSGVYIYRVTAGQDQATGRVNLLR